MYTPESPEIYNKNQIILSSGRLLFNAKEDAILLFARQAISLSTEDSVHINCTKEPGFIINAPKIHLGLPKTKKEAKYVSDKLEGQHSQEYRLIRGEIMRNSLHELLDSLSSLAKSMSTSLEGKEGAPYAFAAQAGALNLKIQRLKDEISDSLSEQNFTI